MADGRQAFSDVVGPDPAIDELIPAAYRGLTDLAVNGTYWLGAMVGASANFLFLVLDPDIIGVDLGWLLALLIGPLIGILIWTLRRHIPESPRWLLTHGRADQAEQIVVTLERDLKANGIDVPPVGDDRSIELGPRGVVSYRELARVTLRDYRRRSLVGVTLMSTQAFLHNAIFFTYALSLADFYGIAGGNVGWSSALPSGTAATGFCRSWMPLRRRWSCAGW